MAFHSQDDTFSLLQIGMFVTNPLKFPMHKLMLFFLHGKKKKKSTFVVGFGITVKWNFLILSFNSKN